MKIVSIVGVRPNIMKIASFIKAINNVKSENIGHVLIHTGQHYDTELSESFFCEFGLKKPDYQLTIGSGSHASQVARMMVQIEKLLILETPDWVVCVDDVNTALATALVANFLNIPIVHIEAGLRSYDLQMPEEINRIVVDYLSTILLVPDENSKSNLIKENIPENKIRFVGNLMIDHLVNSKQYGNFKDVHAIVKNNSYKKIVKFKNYILFTVHRPSNVDDKAKLIEIINLLKFELTHLVDIIVWPIHPRAKNQLIALNLFEALLVFPNIVILDPLPHGEMIALLEKAAILVTDSGGLQEESTFLDIPCVTLRNTTERPITLIENGGTNVLAGNDVDFILTCCKKAIGLKKKSNPPVFWDGFAAERSVKNILTYKKLKI
jgi:UDP-N-acetylglucosamine 2-epimerase (non-hydrolysing)